MTYNMFAFMNKSQQWRCPLIKFQYEPNMSVFDIIGSFPSHSNGFRNISNYSSISVGTSRINGAENVNQTPLIVTRKLYQRVRLNSTTSRLRHYTKQINSAQTIHNCDVFGGSLDSDEVVIVVQTHGRWAYLLALIESLRSAAHINRTLLVISHDIYEPIVESLPSVVTFCKFVQIFYPYSIQLNPNEFPGDDPRDCGRNLKQNQAYAQGCLNAQYPDKFGHYREAKFSQIKHHWWWKVNHVMSGLNVTRDFDGPIVLLEEDHYVSPDFLHVLRLIRSTRHQTCPTCSMIVLGTYAKTFNYHLTGNQVDEVKFLSSRHNMGMTFDRSLWREILNCTQAFCTFDDYNWDWSLQHISLKCMKSPIKALVVRSTRVFHIGECGTHYHGKNCSNQRALSAAQHVMKAAQRYLFPKEMVVKPGVIPARALKTPKGNGGWGDIRDRRLCQRFTRDTISDLTASDVLP